MRRAVRIAGFTLVWLGLFLFGFVGYQLWVTDILNGRVQEDAREELAAGLAARRADLAAPVVVSTTAPPAGSTVTVPTTAPEAEPVILHPESVGTPGEPFGEMRIPAIGLDAVVFTGVDTDTLAKGPGHMPWTDVPGQPGNAVISGHRTTHGRPFFDLDLLEPGDTIEVDTAIGTHVYTVRETVIVAPTDVWVTEERRGAWLTLTTCNPKFSARERLVVFAELTAGPNLAYVQHLLDEDMAAVS
jgi:sortase A